MSMQTPPTLAQALAVQSPTEILVDLLADATANNVNVVGFDLFSMSAALPSLDAQAQAQAQAMRAEAVAGQFLDLAVGLADPSWIRRLACGFYQIAWIPASAAVWEMTLTNTSSGGPYTIAPRQFKVASPTGIVFYNTGGGVLMAGSGQTLPLVFNASVNGTTGNLPGTTAMAFTAGSLPGVTVALTTLLIAAVNDETNTALAARCRSRWGTLGYGGIASAYLYLVSQAAPTINRVAVRDDNPGGPGTVWLYLANPAGPATGPELAAVRAYFGPRKVLGNPPVGIFAAAAQTIVVVATIYTDGTNPNAATLAAAELAAYASTFQPPGLIDVALIESICRGGAFPALGLSGFTGGVNVGLSSPTMDTSILAASVPVFDTSGLVQV